MRVIFLGEAWFFPAFRNNKKIFFVLLPRLVWKYRCYHIYSVGTLAPYQTCPKISTRLVSILLVVDMSKDYWMTGKQWRPWSDTVFCSVWSGSTLFAQAYLSVTTLMLIMVYNVSKDLTLGRLFGNNSGIFFSYFSIKIFVVDTQCSTYVFVEAFLMDSHNVYLYVLWRHL